MAKNTVCHVEWQVTSFDNAERFYGGLFGWKFTKWGEEYMLFEAESGPGGGFTVVKKIDAGQSPLVHIEVDEIEPYLSKATELGGKVAVPKTEIPQVGWFAVLNDIDGNVLGLYQGMKKD